VPDYDFDPSHDLVVRAGGRAWGNLMVHPRHQALIDVSSYPADTEVPWFARKVICAKCGVRGRHIDVRPNWKEQPTRESLTGKHWR